MTRDKGSAVVRSTVLAPDARPDKTAFSASVIIAAYTEERWNSIVAAVTSVIGQSPPPIEVILVIDHNPTLAERARAELTDITVVENVESKGASGARNTGVAISRGEILVFLDDDQVAVPGWLPTLCRHFADERVVGVGGGIKPDWPVARPRWFPQEFDWVVGGSYTGMPRTAAPIRNVWSGNMAIRRSVFEAVDGFRAGFGKIGEASRPEDTDLCLRVRRAFPRGHWLYDPDAEVAHIVPVARTSGRFFVNRCWAEGRGKAALALLNGVDDSTLSERQYTTRVIPRAILRELYRSVIHRDVASLQRVGAIVVGLSAAIAGLLTELLAAQRRRISAGSARAADSHSGDSAERESFRPIRVDQWDIVDPFPTLLQRDAGDCADRIHLLVRMGTEPLGCIDVDVANASLLPGVAAAEAFSSFAAAINARLTMSGLPAVGEIPVAGLGFDRGRLAFETEREQLLANAPRISVVICTRDRPERVAACMELLGQQAYPSFEIIVIDNAPTDPAAVPAALARLKLPVPVRYMLEPRGGTGWARNTGWLAAAADIIAFLDDDVVPDEHWLAELVRGFAARPQVGCVTGMVLPAELRTQAQQWFEGFGGFAKGRGFTQEVFEPGHAQSPLYPLPQFGAGANMAFRRAALVDINGFHVALGGGTPAKGSEDTYAFTRTLLGRHTLVYQPTALSWHYHRETLVELKTQLRGYGIATAAFYAALIAHDPKLIPSLVRLMPTALKDLRGKDSVRTATTHDFPARLFLTELMGALIGIPAFVYSAIRQRSKGAVDKSGRR